MVIVKVALRILTGVIVMAMTIWGVGVLYYSPLVNVSLRPVLAALFAIATTLAFLLLPNRRRTLLRFFARQAGKPVTGFTAEARTALERHAWPGNLRELRNAIERGVILATGPEIGLSDLRSRYTRDITKAAWCIGWLTMH